jgi:7 transmembrane sweet-taste receptor of 3 GCPR
VEIRTFIANWKSSVIVGWLIQIVLSELLGVPATIEGGTFGEAKSFYDQQARLNMTTASNASALIVPFGLPNYDCTFASKTHDNYEQCAHVIGENWDTDSAWISDLRWRQQVEAQGLGVIGMESWYVTQFTSKTDPTIVSYHGLVGDQNRVKLAGLFKRPITFGDYCSQVSSTNCTIPDTVAQRPPQNSEEQEMYFLPGWYTGHFRDTDANNCTRYPTNCTGHFANYPCGWTGHVESLLYHLDIAMEAPRYSYSQLTQLWHAANATRSNLMMIWWTPEPLYQHFLGTDAEMQRVLLPATTQKCVNTFPSAEDECAEDFLTRVGSPDGSCDHAPISLHKLLSSSLQDIATDTEEAVRNPATELLRQFSLTELQLGEIFELWQTLPTPRDAVCQWASQNLEFLNTAIPPSYPRSLKTDTTQSFMFALVMLGSFATLLVATTAGLVHRYRTMSSIRHAQPGFLGLLLMGSFMVSVGAVLLGVPATNGTCIASAWFINVGYTLELVPLIIKVSAINQMMAAASRMRRINISIQSLYRRVALIGLLCVLFLTIWTILDPPTKEAVYTLTDPDYNNGKRIVSVSYFCGTRLLVWQYAVAGWNAVLLLCASVLAFQARNVSAKFNESRTLAFLIYSHFVFVCLRLGTLALQDQLDGTTIARIQSLLYSVDTIATVVIYFLPKFRSVSLLSNSAASGGAHGLDDLVLNSSCNGNTAVRCGEEGLELSACIDTNAKQNPEESPVAPFGNDGSARADQDHEDRQSRDSRGFPFTVCASCQQTQGERRTIKRRSSWSHPELKGLLSDYEAISE